MNLSEGTLEKSLDIEETWKGASFLWQTLNKNNKSNVAPISL
jgi:hypothetical protein